MYCPECGADAGASNFCRECGADLRDLASSPDCTACGSELPEGAGFCPECGEPTGAGRAAVEAPPAATAKPAAGAGGGRRTGTRGKGGAGQQRPQRRERPRAQSAAAAAAPARQPGRVSPAVAWSVLGAVVVAAIVVVVLLSQNSGGSAAPVPTTGSQSGQAVAADTSGSYGELVQRANGLYDQGAAKFQAKDYAQGAEYFRAASKVYAAAWKQQPGDPSVGTDYATSLFYAGDTDGAVKQVEVVLAKSPDFQTGWFNKGNYLAERARQAEQAGSTKVADKAYAEARTAYQKAVDLDPGSSSGQQAKQRMAELPQ